MTKIDVSIIVPVYKPNKKILDDLRKIISKQKTSFSFETLFIDGKNGLANTYNEGIKKSKGKIIVMLHQDCLPKDLYWLEKVIKPFENPGIVISSAYIIDWETNKKYFPFPPDGKSTAYLKQTLAMVGNFDAKTYFTGGEDVDLYLKMMKHGKLAKADTFVTHFHKGYLGNKTVEKRKQNGSINGCLVRIWGIKNPFWWKAIIMSIKYPTTYGKQFIRAFINKKQDYRRDDPVNKKN